MMHALTHAVRTALLVLVAALIAWGPADAENGRRADIATALQGTVTVTRASLGTPRVLKFRDDVMLQDRIATGDQSVVRILLGGKAVITVRERSVVTITESPKVSTVDVADGKIALAVAKERMRPGESIDVRTPHAVAGIRGTVVIAEVARRGADTSTRFTLLTGVIEVLRLDRLRQPVGTAAILNPLQTISIDSTLSPVRPITRTEGTKASADFGIRHRQGQG
jgi:FecR-like protein